MYNLIMSGNPDAFNGEPFELDRDRVGEHTDDAIRHRFESLDEAAISELLSLPTLFAYEAGVKQPGRVGRITQVQSRQGRVRVWYEFNSALPPITPDKLQALAWELDIGKWEFNRTHWAIKAVDLAEALVEANVLTEPEAAIITPNNALPARPGSPARLIVTPTVFSIPSIPVERDLVSVMMPFEAGFSRVFAAIQSACARANLRCLRADNIWQESVLVQDIFNLLLQSSVVVVDFTGKNPNVMYETGIAHTLGRPVIPLAQAVDDVPFDLRHHRFLKYLPNSEGLAEMEVTLSERLRTLTQHGSN